MLAAVVACCCSLIVAPCLLPTRPHPYTTFNALQVQDVIIEADRTKLTIVLPHEELSFKSCLPAGSAEAAADLQRWHDEVIQVADVHRESE